jgi:hypothetical protein
MGSRSREITAYSYKSNGGTKWKRASSTLTSNPEVVKYASCNVATQVLAVHRENAQIGELKHWKADFQRRSSRIADDSSIIGPSLRAEGVASFHSAKRRSFPLQAKAFSELEAGKRRTSWELKANARSDSRSEQISI